MFSENSPVLTSHYTSLYPSSQRCSGLTLALPILSSPTPSLLDSGLGSHNNIPQYTTTQMRSNPGCWDASVHTFSISCHPNKLKNTQYPTDSPAPIKWLGYHLFLPTPGQIRALFSPRFYPRERSNSTQMVKFKQNHWPPLAVNKPPVLICQI